MKRAVLAMSGGVDSSVAAHLLLDQGYEVVGVFMRHGEPVETCSDNPLAIIDARADHKQGCCSASDAEDARRVANRANIPFYALDLRDEFGQIMDYFVAEYVSGRTPNPCVMCNNWLKFGKLFSYADSIGAQYVATGHYARLSNDTSNKPQLLRGIDHGKDQSYVLFGVESSLLDRMLLPIGGYRKTEIREMADSFGLAVADKRDSQEICFVTSGKHSEFVAARKSEQHTEGSIVTTDGRAVGKHDGIERFTVGQRKGLGVAMGEPYFVVKIDPDNNDVVIGKRDDLARNQLRANRMNWFIEPPRQPLKCQAQIRYNSSAKSAQVVVTDDDHFECLFDEPCHGVAPGQAVVCYDGERVLGGGWIL